MNETTKGIVYASIIGLAVIVVSWRLFFSGGEAALPQRSADELRAVVEQAPSQPNVQSSSSSSLAVASEGGYRPASSGGSSDDSFVRDERIDAIGQLGQLRDKKSVPVLLQAMEDPDPVIRGKAAVAVGKIMKADFYFRAEDPPKRRAEILQLIRTEWERFRAAGFQ